MNERSIDRALAAVFRTGIGLNAEREDELWSQFCARRGGESAAWAAFAASMMLLAAGLRPAVRPWWLGTGQ